MATYGTNSPFIDKEADEADLERQNQINLATIGAVSKAIQYKVRSELVLSQMAWIFRTS